MRKYLFILLSFFLITPCYAQQGMRQVRISDFSGGMNSYSLSDVLEPNQAASMVNVVINRPGRITKRKGQALFNLDVGSTAFVGIGRFDPDATTSYLVAASGTDVIRSLSSSTSWTVANPASPLTTEKNTEFVQADDLLFVLNGFDATAWYTGSKWEESFVYPSSPPTASTGAWLRNYLFLAGATDENDWVYFSNNLEPTVFDATDIIKINTGDGQKVQHMEPYRLNELIIYKERSVFVLDISGDSPFSLTAPWTVQPISTVIGTDAPRSVVSLGNDQWFLSSEPIAIRSLNRTEFDKILVNMVSAPIQDVFDQTGLVKLNVTKVDKSAAILFDNKYIIAIPTGTSLVNNTVFVHDFITSSWYRIDGWFPSDWIEFDNRLFYIDANDGRVIECFSGTIGDWEEGPNFINSGSDPTVGIQFEYVSRSIDFDLPENFKTPEALEVELAATGNYNAGVYINRDLKGWVKVGTVNLAGTATTLPTTLPSPLNEEGFSRKTFHIQDQGEFKKIQVRVNQLASNQSVQLNRGTIFARPKPWRRE